MQPWILAELEIAAPKARSNVDGGNPRAAQEAAAQVYEDALQKLLNEPLMETMEVERSQLRQVLRRQRA